MSLFYSHDTVQSTRNVPKHKPRLLPVSRYNLVFTFQAIQTVLGSAARMWRKPDERHQLLLVLLWESLHCHNHVTHGFNPPNNSVKLKQLRLIGISVYVKSVCVWWSSTSSSLHICFSKTYFLPLMNTSRFPVIRVFVCKSRHSVVLTFPAIDLFSWHKHLFHIEVCKRPLGIKS